MISNKSGKIPAVKNGSSGGIKKMLAGTRQRLILTSCAIAVFVVFLAAIIIISIVHSDNASQINDTANHSENQESPKNTLPPPPPPVPQSSTSPSLPNDKPAQSSTTPPSPPEPSPKDSTPAKIDDSANVPPVEQQPKNESKDNPPKPTPPAPIETTSQEASANPPEPATTANSLKDLQSSIELPPLGDDNAPVSLGKVHLDASAKLHVELIGGDNAGRGSSRYVLQEDPNAVGGQAWNISRDSQGKTSPLARLKFKGEDLTFSWFEGVSAIHGNSLRNCGVAITAGEANHFVQFRTPKSAEPIQLDVDKGASIALLRMDNLPELDKLKLKIQPLNATFPAHTIQPAVGVPPRKMVEINFTDPNVTILSIYIFYDTMKKDAISIESSFYMRGKSFKSSSIDSMLNYYKSALNTRERQLASAKNNPNVKANMAQLAATAKNDLEQTNQSVELAKKLNTQLIQYQIILDYEKYQIVLFDSGLSPSKETVETAKAASTP
jgi:hypothetical protein